MYVCMYVCFFCLFEAWSFYEAQVVLGLHWPGTCGPFASTSRILRRVLLCPAAVLAFISMGQFQI
jgi:hypothetical protein